MPEAAPKRRRNKPAEILLLLIVAFGTLALCGLGAWALLRDNRSDGLTYLSFGILWFMFWSWILRIVANPRPA